jgi:hypothetical protein
MKYLVGDLQAVIMQQDDGGIFTLASYIRENSATITSHVHRTV